MVNRGLVSIIIPVYNVSPFLSEALDSVIHQSYDDLEIIIIDDGSTDGSGEICDRYAKEDERIAVIHQQNNGLSHARNVGLDLASGETIAFLDADDAYNHNYIDVMMSLLLKEKADIVISKFTIHHMGEKLVLKGNERVLPLMPQGNYDRCNALQALASNKLNVSVWNKLYKRKLWESIRFPVGHVYEDRVQFAPPSGH